MKYKISKAEYEKLSDEQKAMYGAKGDDYQLQVEGLPDDYDAVLAKNQQLMDEAKQAKQARNQIEAQAKADAEEAARKSGNVQELEKSWGDKLEQILQQHKAEVGQAHDQLAKVMVTKEAQTLASRIFGKNAGPLLHNVTSRLTLEKGENGEFKTRVLDKDGKASALTLADLEKEFSSSEDFKSFLVATKATGPSGALQSANSAVVERSRGGESPEERRERARAIAASDSD